MLGYIIVLSVLSASVGGEDICCAPDKWFAHKLSAGLLLRTVEGVNVPFTDDGESQTYYDAANERSVVISNYSLDDTAEESKTIFDHQQNLLYKINLKKETCTIEELSRPFEKFCITDKFTKDYDFVLGSGSNTLSSTTYSIDKGNVVDIVQVSKECIPVQFYSIGKDKHYFLETAEYYTFGSDFDDSIFDPPEYCPVCSEASKKRDTPSFQEVPLSWRRLLKV